MKIMNDNLEKNIPLMEKNENPVNSENVNINAEDFENLSTKTEIEINSSAEALVEKGSELLASEEVRDYPETQELKELNQEIINLQNEAVDSVEWIKKRFNLDKSQKENFLGIEIQGTNEFREKIKNSLKVLSLAPEKLNFSQKNIERIQEWSHSGMNMFKDKSTFELGDVWRDSDETYLASGIAHDAYHSHLCKESLDSKGNISLGSYIGKEAEKKCLNFQIETLNDVGLDNSMQNNRDLINNYKEYLAELAVNPTYQDIPYEERNW